MAVATGSCEEEQLTLEQAIKDKYCLEEGEDPSSNVSKDFNETALGHRPGNCPLERLRTVVLERKGVQTVGDVDTLTQLCPSVQELHLNNNAITCGEDVCKILTAMPSLRLINLGQNPLNSGTFLRNGQNYEQLSTLVLNSTCISWSALEACLLAIKQLLELHLSMNCYLTVDLTDAFKHSNLKQLYLNDNSITKWEEFNKLSHAFPSLQTLIASGNPVEEIPPLSADIFPSLSTLNLNGSSLCLWQCIEHLHQLVQLKDLSVLKIPLAAEMEGKQRRKAFVARLPKIAKLNKTMITDTERETAERWLLREMAGQPQVPAVYEELVRKHGRLDPLADVNLNPVKMVTLKIVFWDQEDRVEERRVNVDQTVWKFKKMLAEKLVGMPVTSFKLRAAGKIMKNEKYLYSYRFFDGDQVQIEMK